MLALLDLLHPIQHQTQRAWDPCNRWAHRWNQFRGGPFRSRTLVSHLKGYSACSCFSFSFLSSYLDIHLPGNLLTCSIFWFFFFSSWDILLLIESVLQHSARPPVSHSRRRLPVKNRELGLNSLWLANTRSILNAAVSIVSCDPSVLITISLWNSYPSLKAHKGVNVSSLPKLSCCQIEKNCYNHAGPQAIRD